MAKAKAPAGVTISMRTDRKGRTVITAKSRRSGIDLRKVFGIAADEVPPVVDPKAKS